MGSVTCNIDIINPRGPPTIRLAWPKNNDKRRSLVGKVPPRKERNGNIHDLFIVSVSQRDMEMHYSTTDLTLDLPMRWSPVVQNTGEQELLHHFQVAASRALAILCHDLARLGNALIRIALASNTASAGALFKSMLAFSSLHRNDVHSQAVELKVSAIKALGAASGGSDIGVPEAIQHVSTGMLLCSFETHQSTCTSGDWQLYLSGVKHIIYDAGLDQIPDRCEDLALLLDWVYYNDVHARFSRQYWHRKPTRDSLLPPPGASLRAPSPPVTRNSSTGIIFTHLLSEVIDAVAASPSPTASTVDINNYNEFIKILDWRIRNVKIQNEADHDPDTPLILELYRLAILIYLDRASRTQSNPRSKMQRTIDAAFQIIPRLQSCDRQFPIFIIGCEARQDEQRAAILDLIARTEKRPSSRAFVHTPLLLQAVWAQEDLAVGMPDRMDYGEKLTTVISCCRIMPSFV